MRRSLIFALLITIIWFVGQTCLSQTQPVSADADDYHVFLPVLLSGNANNSNSEPETTFPSLTQFVSTVKNGNGQITGVYVEKLMANPVTQQPQGNYEYISNDPNTITQFMLTTPEVIGLLAHNYLAGKSFFDIKIGDSIFIIDGYGGVAEYQVVEIDSYQVTKIDGVVKYLDINEYQVLDTAQLFAKFYMGEKHLTLQTCIAKGGDPVWGRLFITAVPVK
ncbi:hypothetical protein [Bellilinea sp.]|uniref:hypothetical protein n=1 Tax=Bellilinea sp. TaxID=2838785 RepID=UPI002ADE30FA|nr:hypothetical protein [Bellilinea sp.]